MANKKKKAAEWAEAQRKCRLSDEAVRMAKELGMAPRGLIKNIPSRSESWKAPVEDWVRMLHRKREDKARARKARRALEVREEYSLTDLGVDMEIENLTREAAEDEHGGVLPMEDDPGSDDEVLFLDFEDEDGPPSQKDIEDENAAMLRRQRQFRQAAEYVAGAFARHPALLKVAMIGSVALPLKKEVPRFRQFRRAGIAILHECRDIDLAVWLADLSRLKELRRSLVRALQDLLSEQKIGVANHQVDVFILEPRTDRYRGRLCHFGSCPKQGKIDCHVPGCGLFPFLQQHSGFDFNPLSLAPERMVVLFNHQGSGVVPQVNHSPDEADDSDIPF